MESFEFLTTFYYCIICIVMCKTKLLSKHQIRQTIRFLNSLGKTHNWAGQTVQRDNNSRRQRLVKKKPNCCYLVWSYSITWVNVCPASVCCKDQKNTFLYILNKTPSETWLKCFYWVKDIITKWFNSQDN